jgi:hypothetical protein
MHEPHKSWLAQVAIFVTTGFIVFIAGIGYGQFRGEDIFQGKIDAAAAELHAAENRIEYLETIIDGDRDTIRGLKDEARDRERIIGQLRGKQQEISRRVENLEGIFESDADIYQEIEDFVNWWFGWQ